jgi:non-homologous end joining protein Ku
VALHQVHAADGGRIRGRRYCEQCGQEVDYSDIAKGYTDHAGRTAVLTEADLDQLPSRPAGTTAPESEDVADLMAALQASIDARAAHNQAPAPPARKRATKNPARSRSR